MDLFKDEPTQRGGEKSAGNAPWPHLGPGCPSEWERQGPREARARGAATLIVQGAPSLAGFISSAPVSMVSLDSTAQKARGLPFPSRCSHCGGIRGYSEGLPRLNWSWGAFAISLITSPLKKVCQPFESPSLPGPHSLC